MLENKIDAGRPPLSLSRAARESSAGYGAFIAAYDEDGDDAGDDGRGVSRVDASDADQGVGRVDAGVTGRGVGRVAAASIIYSLIVLS